MSSRRKALPILVLYARYDGSFAVWDSARSSFDHGNLKPAHYILLQSDEAWNGKDIDREQPICQGMLRDWVQWQTGGQRYRQPFSALEACLRTLSPSEEEALEPDELTRLLRYGSREIPTIKMPYGTVPVVHASAGVKRVLSLAYMLVWTWHEHLANSNLIRREA